MSQTEMLTPVALYARDSSRIDEEESTIRVESQLNAMREYAKSNQMFPISHFVDKFGNREEFDWMMAQATSDNPPFRTILVYSRNRLTRSANELMALLDELETKGLDLVSVTQH